MAHRMCAPAWRIARVHRSAGNDAGGTRPRAALKTAPSPQLLPLLIAGAGAQLVEDVVGAFGGLDGNHAGPASEGAGRGVKATEPQRSSALPQGQQKQGGGARPPSLPCSAQQPRASLPQRRSSPLQQVSGDAGARHTPTGIKVNLHKLACTVQGGHRARDTTSYNFQERMQTKCAAAVCAAPASLPALLLQRTVKKDLEAEAAQRPGGHSPQPSASHQSGKNCRCVTSWRYQTPPAAGSTRAPAPGTAERWQQFQQRFATKTPAGREACASNGEPAGMAHNRRPAWHGLASRDVVRESAQRPHLLLNGRTLHPVGRAGGRGLAVGGCARQTAAAHHVLREVCRHGSVRQVLQGRGRNRIGASAAGVSAVVNRMPLSGDRMMRNCGAIHHAWRRAATGLIHGLFACPRHGTCTGARQGSWCAT